MQSERLPLNGQGFHLSGGDLGLWTPGRGTMIVTLRGRGRAAFAAPFIAVFDEVRAEQRPVALFVDAGGLESYESSLRSDLTEHFKRHRGDIARLDVLVRSPLVAMGVSVASLALGGLVKAHATDAAFRLALGKELAARHVVGFSTDVLRPRSSSTG